MLSLDLAAAAHRLLLYHGPLQPSQETALRAQEGKQVSGTSQFCSQQYQGKGQCPPSPLRDLLPGIGVFILKQ